MKLKRKLIMSLLGGAMLALPMTAPAFAEPSFSANSNGIEQVDWWWDNYKGDRNAYANHGWHSGYYEYSGKRYSCDRASSRTKCGEIGPRGILLRLKLASWGAYRSSPRIADTAAKSSAAGSGMAVNRTLPPAPTIKARGQGPIRTTPRRCLAVRIRTKFISNGAHP